MQEWVTAYLNCIANFLSMLQSIDFLGVPFLWILVALVLIPAFLRILFGGL